MLRDLLGVYSPMAAPVASSPPRSADEHVNTLRSEYKEYKAEALDAFELSVLVDGSLRHLHPAPGNGGDDRAAASGVPWTSGRARKLCRP